MNRQSMTAAELRILRADAERVRAQQDQRTEPAHQPAGVDATQAVAA